VCELKFIIFDLDLGPRMTRTSGNNIRKTLVKISVISGFLFNLGISAPNPQLIFKENKGQWLEKVLFGTEFLNTQFYVNRNGFSYCIYNTEEMIRAMGKIKSERGKAVHGHNYEVEFIGAAFNHYTQADEEPGAYNYFLGKDKNRWASNVKAFGDLSFKEIYKGIDLRLYSKGINLKYDLIVKINGDPDAIKINYKYADSIEIRNKELIIKTSVGEVIEKAPFAYQMINGKQVRVKCEYNLLRPGVIKFIFPEGYNKKHELIIDPTVVVCSYSKATNYAAGDACTYDTYGNIYVGAEAFVGYPTTTGAFQLNGHPNTPYGGVDMVISKYNNTGSARFFSTYIGGDYSDAPIDMKIKDNSIIVYGISNSLNYPCTPMAMDTSYNSAANFLYDLVVTKLDTSGSALLASTYVGGVGSECFNHFSNTAWGWGIGEMEVDSLGNVYGLGSTNSANFPTSAGALSPTLKGGSDAFVFKLDNNLSTLLWSTYLGGTGHENGVSLRSDGAGGVYCFGSTTSTNFPVTNGAYNTTKNGVGVTADMYVSHINASGTTFLASTYLGTTSQDYAHMMDLDRNGDLYFFGNFTLPSSLLPTPGTYNDASGCNFIYKMDPALSSVIFKTRFGNFVPQVSPYLTYNAVKTDSCGKIYISGFGGNSFPTTPNAFQPYGGGPTDLYMMVFNANCSSLSFASFFGGSQVNSWSSIQSSNPGEATGLADFDNKGCLYTAIAIPGGLPTTPNAYATSVVSTSTSVFCNDAFFKADMQTFINANSSYGANITGCPPFTANFVSTTNTGTTYWDLGDGTTSTQDTISHSYTNLGNYNILLLVTDTNTCNKTDSIKSKLSVISPTEFDLGQEQQICLNSKLILKSPVAAIGYTWSTGATTNTTSITEPGNYQLSIFNGGCETEDDLNVVLGEASLAERFPNVITPNNDGINDFIDFTKYNFGEMDFHFYDRWGNERYKNSDPTIQWNPSDFNAGTYYYVIKYFSSCTEESKEGKGFISLFK
jgi:hypothetical protein